MCCRTKGGLAPFELLHTSRGGTSASSSTAASAGSSFQGTLASVEAESVRNSSQPPAASRTSRGGTPASSSPAASAGSSSSPGPPA